MYQNPQAVVQVNGKRSEAFAIKRSVWQGCPLFSLLYVLALEASPALRGILFADPLLAKVSAYADDITVFVSRRLDIEAVKKAVVRYSLCLRIIGWCWNDPSLNYFGVVEGRWSVDRSVVNVCIMGVWVCLIWRTTGSLKDWLTWANPYRRTWYRGERWAIHFFASSQTPRLKVNVGWKAKHRLFANAVRLSATFLGPVTFLGFERNCIGI